MLDASLRADLAEMFRHLGDPNRLGIVLACTGGERSVNAIAAELQLAPSLVSHHLRLLRTARLLRARRVGRQIFYGLADEHVRRMLTDMIDHAGHADCAPASEEEAG